MTITNKYGEEVELHGPVCFECHQRMQVSRVTSVRGIDGVNVCLHCKPFSSMSVFELAEFIRDEAASIKALVAGAR